ncbi:hypothetical protein [Streptomyces sp. CA-179760]|uniref:hypothetical protein n=1 Tax=Streptomyces sp. CA-179760 TaxID=3240054 RepID=UPI003D92F33F
MENQTPPGNGSDQTPPVSEGPQGASEGDDIGRFAIGVVLLTSMFMTLLAELALAIVGAGLKVTAMAGVIAFGGTFGLGCLVIKWLGRRVF